MDGIGVNAPKAPPSPKYHRAGVFRDVDLLYHAAQIKPKNRKMFVRFAGLPMVMRMTLHIVNSTPIKRHSFICAPFAQPRDKTV